MDKGWVKVHRKLLDNPVVCKDADHIAVWMFMLLSATHTPQQVLFGGDVTTLKPGQFISGRNAISKAVKVEENKVNRIIKFFKKQQLIEQQASTKNSLFTILNWNEYQESEQQNEQQVNSKCTTGEHKQECKNGRMKEYGEGDKPKSPKKPSRKSSQKSNDAPVKRSYGEFENVLLTEEEYLKVQARIVGWDKYIEKLSAYMDSKGKTYKNHYSTLLNWARNDGKLKSEKDKDVIADNMFVVPVVED